MNWSIFCRQGVPKYQDQGAPGWSTRARQFEGPGRGRPRRKRNLGVFEFHWSAGFGLGASSCRTLKPWTLNPRCALKGCVGSGLFAPTFTHSYRYLEGLGISGWWINITHPDVLAGYIPKYLSSLALNLHLRHEGCTMGGKGRRGLCCISNVGQVNFEIRREGVLVSQNIFPYLSHICSMSGIFTNVCAKNDPVL